MHIFLSSSIFNLYQIKPEIEYLGYTKPIDQVWRHFQNTAFFVVNTSTCTVQTLINHSH